MKTETTTAEIPAPPVIKIDGSSEFLLFKPPAKSGWVCYMFGNKPGGWGLEYRPNKGDEPNAFVRWMMKVCFACTWVKEKK